MLGGFDGPTKTALCRAAVPQSLDRTPGSPRAAQHRALSCFQIVAQVIGKNTILLSPFAFLLS